ncbi:MAG: hypothetical protein ACOC56_04490 [Atribacterota bacterium]
MNTKDHIYIGYIITLFGIGLLFVTNIVLICGLCYTALFIVANENHDQLDKKHKIIIRNYKQKRRRNRKTIRVKHSDTENKN